MNEIIIKQAITGLELIRGQLRDHDTNYTIRELGRAAIKLAGLPLPSTIRARIQDAQTCAANGNWSVCLHHINRAIGVLEKALEPVQSVEAA